MPIPFRDAEALDELGVAAYLLIERPADSHMLGALFLVNARGEPVEFVHNRVELPRSPLWRPIDLRRKAERVLAASLFSICASTPRIVLCDARNIDRFLFADDLHVRVPVGRIADPLVSTPVAAGEVSETLANPTSLQVHWTPSVPAPGSAERTLFDRITTSGLLREPLDRARSGLAEVYADEDVTVSGG